MRPYTVRRGDTLRSIAKRELGDAARWRELKEQNRLKNPDRLRVGQKLELPENDPFVSMAWTRYGGNRGERQEAVEQNDEAPTRKKRGKGGWLMLGALLAFLGGRAST